jgi:hypothetical protein
MSDLMRALTIYHHRPPADEDATSQEDADPTPNATKNSSDTSAGTGPAA